MFLRPDGLFEGDTINTLEKKHFLNPHLLHQIILLNFSNLVNINQLINFIPFMPEWLIEVDRFG